MNVSLSQPDIGEREIELVNQVLRSPQLSGGPFLERFENDMARYIGLPWAVGVTNGTCGLHLAVAALGIGEGDEVITTPFSFVASANCILFERARPVFVDIEPASLSMDPEQIERAITPRTKAILPVHVFGHPAPMDRITTIASRHGLAVIEDACEALGAASNGRKAGTFGDCAVFAFYPNKQMTTAEGGVIVTARGDLAEAFKSMRNQGRDRSGTWLQHVRLGYNYRLDELRAALGVAQLERIEELLAKRDRVACAYSERLQGKDGIEVQGQSPRVRMSWFVYVIRVPEVVDRDRVGARLAERGIPTRPYFHPIHLQPFYREAFGYREGAFPVCEQVARRCLALPFYGSLSEDAVERVCNELRDAVQRESRNG
jgi:perosamine synthetase